MDEWVTFEYDDVITDTELAVLFDCGDEEPVWIPRSVLENDWYSDPGCGPGEVEIPLWFAEKNGLV